MVTDGENNNTGWSNAEYDRLIAAARAEPDEAKRFELFHQAERILMDEMPIIPIYYYVDKNMLKTNVRGFYRNPLDQHPLSAIWIDEAPNDDRRTPGRRQAEPHRQPPESRIRHCAQVHRRTTAVDAGHAVGRVHDLVLPDADACPAGRSTAIAALEPEIEQNMHPPLPPRRAALAAVRPRTEQRTSAVDLGYQLQAAATTPSTASSPKGCRSRRRSASWRWRSRWRSGWSPASRRPCAAARSPT